MPFCFLAPRAIPQMTEKQTKKFEIFGILIGCSFFFGKRNAEQKKWKTRKDCRERSAGHVPIPSQTIFLLSPKTFLSLKNDETIIWTRLVIHGKIDCFRMLLDSRILSDYLWCSFHLYAHIDQIIGQSKMFKIRKTFNLALFLPPMCEIKLSHLLLVPKKIAREVIKCSNKRFSYYSSLKKKWILNSTRFSERNLLLHLL